MTSSPKTSKSFMRAIDRLKKAANLEATKKEVELSDGSIFEMWVAPLTMAERERAQRGAKSDDAQAVTVNFRPAGVPTFDFSRS